MANWFHSSHLQQLCGGCFQDPALFLHSILSFAETKKQWNFHARWTEMLTNILYPQRSIKVSENNYVNVILTGEGGNIYIYMYIGFLFILLIVLFIHRKGTFCRFSSIYSTYYTNTSPDSICFFLKNNARNQQR